MFLCDSAERRAALQHLLGFHGIRLQRCEPDVDLLGSYWGGAEAGIAQQHGWLLLFLRDDTPVHSVLHEAAHVVCMSPARRTALFGDAGGDHAEENAVCYLQILWSGLLPELDRGRLMQDMDTWGYSFRLGSARRWFEDDAQDARQWLLERQMISVAGEPTGRLNQREA